MCGICGLVRFEGPPELALVEAMLGRLAHRGPDGSGYFRDRTVALGHTRLAIIDTAGGAQPLSNEDGTVWVSFNGEIFNYLELREELVRAGHRFHTETDTEVIVHAWEQWGLECFPRFNGQWAIALWDTRRRELILSRDRLGVRPLFYSLTDRGLTFASEIKALLEDPAVPRELDANGMDEVLTFWSCVAPRTVFRGVRQLQPGHVAVLEGRTLRTHPFWSPEFPARGHEREQDLDVNAMALREALVEACRLRFTRSDVPVGAYLSGGIDSSVTAAVIARYTDAPLRTFSLRFADREYDESGPQEQMVERLGAEHSDIEVSGTDIANAMPAVVWHSETPILRAAPAPMFLLSGLVRESGYKVVVTGEGADEVLAGYDIFREARVRQFWARDPESAVRGRAAELLYPWMNRSPSQAPAFARGFFGRHLNPADPAMSHRPRWESTAALKGLLNVDLRVPDPDQQISTLLARMPADSVGWDQLSRGQWLEMTTLLPGYILASQGDRMLMAHSVEGRFPFLDPYVVDLADGLPARHKLFGLDEKHILKQAFSDLVPAEILHRDKQPYRAPDVSPFFGGREPDWLSEILAPEAVLEAGIFDPRRTQALFDKCRRTRGVGMGNTDSMRVMAVISGQLLHDQFLAGHAPACPPPPEPLRRIDMIEGGTDDG
jgi:asparagine synthase (glutamine-hydrolysing)